MFVFTTEVAEKRIFCLPEGTGKQKALRPGLDHFPAEGLRFIENRHLLSEPEALLAGGRFSITISHLGVLRVSNEPTFRSEWEMKMIWDANDLPLLKKQKGVKRACLTPG
jgi:hypothetical protein